MVRRWFVSAWVLPVCFCIVVAPCAVHAQDPSPDPPADPAPSAAAADPQQARAEFDQKFTQWKESLKELRTLRHEYQVADETTREDMEVQYKLKVAAIQSEMLPVLIEADAPWSNRIHADDLAATCFAAARRGRSGQAYNISDGHPTTMTDYFCRIADLYGLPRPPAITMEEARRVLSPSMLSFLEESKRLDTRRMREELGVELRYPDLVTGLPACL